MKKNELVWIQKGYFLFGRKGLYGLNVELIASELNKSKSSFYHYFGDLDHFIDKLMEYHRSRAKQIAEKGRNCQNMDPDVILLMIETKDDLLFNKQLRLNGQEPRLNACFEETFNTISDSFMAKWNSTIGMNQKPMLGKVIFNLLVDNFFLQVNEHNLDYPWFQGYIQQLRSIIQQIQMAYNQ
ncbi:MAG: TetR/AcrR family transcriptional regulator [Bacteroidota bacterium]